MPRACKQNSKNESMTAFFKSQVDSGVFSQLAARSVYQFYPWALLEGPLKCSSLGPTPRGSNAERGLCSYKKSFVVRQIRVLPWLCHHLAGRPCLVRSPSLRLSFLICQIEITGVMTSCVSWESNWDTKHPAQCTVTVGMGRNCRH